MATDLLRALHAPLADEIAGLALVDDGLRGELDLRYGLVPLQIDHDPEAEALRVSVRLPPPAASGPDFLVWCLALNAQYWDAKLALDDGGYLLVHADVDATPETELAQLQVALIDRVDTIAELIDDDLCDYLLEHHLGTPEQLARWRSELSA
jgi:hypothetical protein